MKHFNVSLTKAFRFTEVKSSHMKKFVKLQELNCNFGFR